jgi:type I restriction enzyme S subunit
MSSEEKPAAALARGPAWVPKLRFPQFIGQPVETLQLADTTTESTDRNGASQARSKIMGVTKVDGIVPMEDRLIAADTARYKVVRKDWFAYNPMRLNIGSIARWQGDTDVLVSPDYVVFKCKSAGPHRLDPAYLDHFRRSDAWEDFVSEKGDGSVRVRIYYKDLARLQLALPSLTEQQKIAECLDSADALIEAQGRKVEALKAHKKSLMRQLFPQEGEAEPRIRFPEFRAAGEWEFVQLGKMLNAPPDYGVSAASALYDKDLPKYLRITDISENGRYIHENKVSVDIVPNAGDYLEEGDIAIARTGASVGKSYRYRKDDGELVFAGFLIRLRPDQRKLATAYLAQYLTTQQYWDWIAINSARSGQPGINSAELSSLSVPVPLPAADQQLREQHRIADCLTSLDDLLAAEIRKLDRVKIHKKGLMQKLFPAVEEHKS